MSKTMRDYPKIFYSLSLLVVLFVHLGLGNSRMSTDLIELAVLVGCTIVLLIAAVKFHREHLRMSAVFLFATALCPWVYYLELYAIKNFLSGDLESEVLEANLVKTAVIYNLLRFALTAFSFMVLFRNFLKALREFYSNT